MPRAAALLVGCLLPSCGVGIQAVYEGNVRFEHCMALDSRPDVKPTIRRACWEEWEKFYTFGQTRDRVDYAYVRTQQLSSVSDFDEGSWDVAAKTGAAAPDPTSVLAPPPITMRANDAGAPSTSPATSADRDPDRPPQAPDCSASCEESRKLCADQCKAATCEKACAAGYKRCLKRCT